MYLLLQDLHPGPLMSAYYASKSYITKLSVGIAKELIKDRSNVKISILPMSSQYVAKYAIKNTLKGKLIIIPGFKTKTLHILSKILPERLVAEFTYYNQKRKT